MIIDIKEKFLIQKAKHEIAEAYLDLFMFYKNKDDKKEYTEGLQYLKLFLLEFHPQESMKIFAKKEGRTFSQESMQEDYLHLVRLVAAIHYDCMEYETGVYWARKAIDLFDFFHCKLNDKTREKIKRESVDYRNATDLFETFKEYFSEELYKKEKGIHFDWENKYYEPQSHANNN